MNAPLDGYAEKIQGSAAWLHARCGNITASRFADVLDITKKGEAGAKRKGYLADVVIERITGNSTEHYVTHEMQWGTDHEPHARMAYEAHTGNMVESTGYVAHPIVPRVGGSPDGLIGDDGIIEIKCPSSRTHLRTLLGEPCAYQAQIQGYLWITGRQWCDFVSYDPRINSLELFVQRIPRDDDYISELAIKVMGFAAEVDAIIAKLEPMRRIVEFSADMAEFQV